MSRGMKGFKFNGRRRKKVYKKIDHTRNSNQTEQKQKKNSEKFRPKKAIEIS